MQAGTYYLFVAFLSAISERNQSHDIPLCISLDLFTKIKVRRNAFLLHPCVNRESYQCKHIKRPETKFAYFAQQHAGIKDLVNEVHNKLSTWLCLKLTSKKRRCIFSKQQFNPHFFHPFLVNYVIMVRFKNRYFLVEAVPETPGPFPGNVHGPLVRSLRKLITTLFGAHGIGSMGRTIQRMPLCFETHGRVS
jgi:hypothetical protein